MLPEALHSDGTYRAPSQHPPGWVKATGDDLLLHPAHTRQTNPEIFHSGQHFHPGKDKRDALGGQQCQLKRSRREMTTQATPQAAEGGRSSNTASFLRWHKRWEQSLPSRACPGEAFLGIGCSRGDAVPCRTPSQSTWTTMTFSRLQKVWSCSLRLGHHGTQGALAPHQESRHCFD